MTSVRAALRTSVNFAITAEMRSTSLTRWRTSVAARDADRSAMERSSACRACRRSYSLYATTHSAGAIAKLTSSSKRITSATRGKFLANLLGCKRS